MIIATKRKEVQDLIEQGDARLFPRRQIHWVERPVGEKNAGKRLHVGGQVTISWLSAVQQANQYLELLQLSSA